jgi:beta-lactamase class A
MSIDPPGLAVQSLIAELEAATGGVIAFALHDLQTARRIGQRAAEPVPTASVIKLPILLHIALAVDEGPLSWDEPLTLAEDVKAPGTGVLKELSAGLSLSLRDLCVLMTALSDNTATNMLLDRMGVDAVNTRLEQLGLLQTRLLRRVFAPDTPATRPFGLGVTTAHEMADLLVQLARGQIGGGRAADTVLAMLAMQQDRAAIPRLLPEGWRYAGKTGSNPDLRADVALLTAPDGSELALAAFCTAMPRADWTVDNPGLLAIARLARALLVA